MNRQEFERRQAADLSERQLQDLILNLARHLGWRSYHTFDSRRSQPGFPDLVLVRGSRVLWRELKAQTGRLSSEQHGWLHDLERAGQDAAVWRPADWFTDVIRNDLEEERR